MRRSLYTKSKGFLPLMELILTLLRVCVVQVLSCMHFVHLSSLISLLFPSHAHTLSFSLSLSLHLLNSFFSSYSFTHQSIIKINSTCTT
ncbi:hypothetical protein L1887_22970 [Cichorium endivia]|nr:hypothetical protein L1887_22970 [Cichorium endivia]